MTNEKEWIKEEFECRYFSDDLTDFDMLILLIAGSMEFQQEFI